MITTVHGADRITVMIRVVYQDSTYSEFNAQNHDGPGGACSASSTFTDSYEGLTLLPHLVSDEQIQRIEFYAHINMPPPGGSCTNVLSETVVGGYAFASGGGVSTLVNYGYYITSSGTYSISSCPTGWNVAGEGKNGPSWDAGGNYGATYWNAFRTCYRTDKSCQTLVNYGNYNSASGTYFVSSCPTGWNESGVGYQGPSWSGTGLGGPYWNAFRTCYLCS